MSFYRLIWLAGALLPAFAAEPTRVGVLLNAPPSTPLQVVEALQSETEDSLRAAGIDIQWRLSGGSASNETFDRVVSLRLTGRCVPTRATTAQKSKVLGFTHISDSRVLPFVEIDCETVLRVMEGGNFHATPFFSPSVFGHALGRVAVHEMHHVLTASSTHDQEGLTKPAFTRTDLTLGGLQLTEAALQRLRHSLGQPDLQAESRGQQRTHAEE